MIAIFCSVFLIYPPGQEVADRSEQVAIETNLEKPSPEGSDVSKSAQGKLQLENGVTISVTSFTFEGNQAIKTEDLQRLTNPYLNRSLSQSEIQAICYRIKALYKQQGYPNAEVFAPAQSAKTTNLKIVIKENKSK